MRLSITSLDSIDVRLTSRSWEFADANAPQIEAHWALRTAQQPSLFNGKVLLLERWLMRDRHFSGECIKTDFKSFLYWREHDAPDPGVFDLFAAGALHSREGWLILGRASPAMSNAGGVYLLWDELCRRYLHFEFMHGHGLGVIGIGANIPPRIRRLFSVSGERLSREIRAAYERLGGLINRSEETARLMEQVRTLEALVQSYEKSTSWRLTAPLRTLATLLKSARTVGQRLGTALLMLVQVAARDVKISHPHALRH